MNLEQKLQEMKRRDKLAEEGGGEQPRAPQHKEGKMSARERIFLLDEGSFEETDKLVTHRGNEFGMAEQKYYGDGFVTGYGVWTDGWYLFSLRTSPFLAVRFRRPTPGKIVKIMDTRPE